MPTCMPAHRSRSETDFPFPSFTAIGRRPQAYSNELLGNDLVSGSILCSFSGFQTEVANV